MHKIRIHILTLLTFFSVNLAVAYDKVDFHCDSDTIIVNQLLKTPELADMDKGDRVAFFARKMVGAPSNLRKVILDSDTMIFTVDIHSFNPLSLISTCIALAKAYETSSAPNWRDFADKYENVMFKNGRASDFVSRFLYPSDWIADNVFRGNISDATQHLSALNIKKKEKSIYYISSNKNSFKAFANQKNLDRIKMLEMGFRNHQIKYISNGDLTNSNRFKKIAEDGDIVFFLSPDESLDSRDMGILFHEGDELKLIRVSTSEEKVVIEEMPFEQYSKRNIKRIQGARLVRIE